MPIIAHPGIPAAAFAAADVPLLPATAARTQDIRPLRVLVLNHGRHVLETETQILRLLANTPLQIEVQLARIGSVERTESTPFLEHYRAATSLVGAVFDAVLAVGENRDDSAEIAAVLASLGAAPASLLALGGLAAGLIAERHGVAIVPLSSPATGVLAHALSGDERLLLGADRSVPVPIARAFALAEADLAAAGLTVLARAEATGAHLLLHRATRSVYALDHLEHTAGAFARAQRRRLAAGDLPIADPGWGTQPWRAYSHLLLANWLNWLVYQPLSLAASSAAAR